MENLNYFHSPRNLKYNIEWTVMILNVIIAFQYFTFTQVDKLVFLI